MRQLLTIPVAAALLLSSCATAFQQPQGSFLLNVEFPRIATSFTTMVIPSETDKIKIQLETSDNQTQEHELTRANPKLRIESLPLGDTEVKAQAFKGSEMLARGATKVSILPGLNTAELELELLDDDNKDTSPPPTNNGSDVSVDLGGSRGPSLSAGDGPPAGATSPSGDRGPAGPGPDGPPPNGDTPPDNTNPNLTSGPGLPPANTSGGGDSIITPRGVATGGTLPGSAATVTLDPPTLSGAGYPVMLKVETPNNTLTYSWSCDSHCGHFGGSGSAAAGNTSTTATGSSVIFMTPSTGGTSVVRLKEMDAAGNFRESTINISVPSGTGSINLNQGVVG